MDMGTWFLSILILLQCVGVLSSSENELDLNHACHEVLSKAQKGNSNVFQLGGSRIEICSAPIHGCVFATGGRRSSCNEVCEQAGEMECVSAWDDLDDDGLCPPGPPVACDRALGSKVCECGRKECTIDEDCGLVNGTVAETRLCHSGRCRLNETSQSPIPVLIADPSKKEKRGNNMMGRPTPGAPESAHMCELLSREILTVADPSSDQLAVHRLRFAVPAGGKTIGGPPFHVKVRAPDEKGQRMRIRAYSAELERNTTSEDHDAFVLTVKIYPGSPPQTRGTSAYLGNVTVGDKVHVPEIRSLGWSQPPSDVTKVGMVAFGVGIAEMIEPIQMVLSQSPGAEVKLIYASRNENQILYRENLRELLAEYPARLSVLHCLSRQKPDDPSTNRECAQGEDIHWGRLDNAILEQQFGEGWSDGTDSYFTVIGTREMEHSIYSWLKRKGMGRTLFTGAMWQPLVPAVASE